MDNTPIKKRIKEILSKNNDLYPNNFKEADKFKNMQVESEKK